MVYGRGQVKHPQSSTNFADIIRWPQSCLARTRYIYGNAAGGTNAVDVPQGLGDDGLGDGRGDMELAVVEEDVVAAVARRLAAVNAALNVGSGVSQLALLVESGWKEAVDR